MNHVIVQQEVSVALGNFFRGNRPAIIAVENRLYDQLANHCDKYKLRRDRDDEALFDYLLNYCDGENWFSLRFSVNDGTAGYLFVEAVSCHIGRIL